MNDCLVTKLKGVVNNDNLPKIGEVKIKFNQVTTPTADTNSIRVKAVYADNGLELRVVNGYFTDSTFQQNLGTTHTIANWATDTVYISNTGATLFIPNKYEHIGIIQYGGDGWYRDNVELNIEDLSYNKYITRLLLRGMNVIGDIGKVVFAGDEFSELNLTNCNNIRGSLDELYNKTQSKFSFVGHGYIEFNMDNLQNVNVMTVHLQQGGVVRGSLANLVAHTYRSQDRNYFPTVLSFGDAECSGVTGNILVLKDFFDVNPAAPGDTLTCYLSTCPNISGSLESLADELVAMGKNAGVLNFNAHPQSQVTINGEAPIEGKTYIVTFTQEGYTIA